MNSAKKILEAASKILVFLLILTSVPASAYIPKFWMILSKTAENHGHGLYLIEQDVTFQHKREPMVFRETWLVKDGQRLRVDIEARKGVYKPVQISFVYAGESKSYIDPNGQLKQANVSPDFFEPYFHFRFSDKMKPRLYRNKIIPQNVVNEERRIEAESQIDNSVEPFMRLTRISGTISYGIGIPTPPNSESLYPGLWIEQDRFNIRKIRFSSQNEIRADQYEAFPRDFHFPKIRTVSWDKHQVQIQLVQVKALPSTKNYLSQLESSQLKNNKKKTTLIQPDDPVVIDFYKRFR